MSRPSHTTDLKFTRAVARALLGRRKGEAWLSEPNDGGGLTPLALAGDHHGADRVIAELDRMVGGKRH